MPRQPMIPTFIKPKCTLPSRRPQIAADVPAAVGAVCNFYAVAPELLPKRRPQSAPPQLFTSMRCGHAVALGAAPALDRAQPDAMRPVILIIEQRPEVAEALADVVMSANYDALVRPHVEALEDLGSTPA